MPDKDQDPPAPMDEAIAAGVLRPQPDGSYRAEGSIPDYRDALLGPPRAEPTITPEDRAVWLGLQLENARLQHEVERLQDEVARLQAYERVVQQAIEFAKAAPNNLP